MIETKKSYVRYISHELRTPLNAVFIGIKLLLDQISPTACSDLEIERRQILQDTSSSCSVVLDILNDLLLYDKLDSGILVLSKETTNVFDLLANCIKMHVVQLQDKCINLKVINAEYSFCKFTYDNFCKE